MKSRFPCVLLLVGILPIALADESPSLIRSQMQNQPVASADDAQQQSRQETRPANVTGMIKGKTMEFTAGTRIQVAQKAVELLASCAFLHPNPQWGAAPNEPESMATVRKGSHLHISFPTPVEVVVPIEKVTVQVHEMVISLPLATGGIWVRTDNRVIYLAKFDHSAAERLNKVLPEAANQ